MNWKHLILSVSLLPWLSPDGIHSPYIAVGIYSYLRAVTKITPYGSSTYQVVLASLQMASPGSSSEALSDPDRLIGVTGSNR